MSNSKIPNFGALLMSCPDDQIKRCQLIINSIAAGEWADAANYARNAARETEGTPEMHHWVTAMYAGAEFCESRSA